MEGETKRLTKGETKLLAAVLLSTGICVVNDVLLGAQFPNALAEILYKYAWAAWGGCLILLYKVGGNAADLD